MMNQGDDGMFLTSLADTGETSSVAPSSAAPASPSRLASSIAASNTGDNELGRAQKQVLSHPSHFTKRSSLSSTALGTRTPRAHSLLKAPSSPPIYHFLLAATKVYCHWHVQYFISRGLFARHRLIFCPDFCLTALTAQFGRAETANIPKVADMDPHSSLALPESVRYEAIMDQVASCRIAAARSSEEKGLWKNLFLDSHEVEEMAKDLFYYFLADEFQSNRDHESTKKALFSRVSSQYVDYYLRCRSHDVDSTKFFNEFHDPLAQVHDFN